MRMPFEFRPDWHVIIHAEPEFMRFLRRRFPRHADHMFLYFHTKTGAFVVGGWANRDRGRMLDLVNLGPACALDRGHVRELRLLLEPTPEEVLTVARLFDVQRDQDGAILRRDIDDQNSYLDAKRAFWKQNVRGSGDSAFYDDVRHRTLIPQPVPGRRCH